VKNKNNINSLNFTSRFKITFLIFIFALIRVTATLTADIKFTAVVFAQGNNSTNSTSLMQLDIQTSGVGNNPHSKFPYKSALDLVPKNDYFTPRYSVNPDEQHKSLGSIPQPTENESK
jgi:hypothetical protein